METRAGSGSAAGSVAVSAAGSAAAATVRGAGVARANGAAGFGSSSSSTNSGHGGVDTAMCLRKGLVGALGAIPGTILSHPMDVVKIRMQTTGTESCMAAVRHIASSSCRSGVALVSPPCFWNFYRGLWPAIEMRLVGRGPMFLFSELFTELLEGHTSLAGASARFVGSAGSGYSVGFLAGMPEYRKKLLSQGVLEPSAAGWASLWRSAVAAGQHRSFARRMHAAGSCSMVYDATFFSMQYHLQRHRGLSAPVSYAAAAAFAVVLAFPFDTAVARMLVVPPGTPVRPLHKVVSELFATRPPRAGDSCGGHCSGVLASLEKLVPRTAFRGLAARVVEFAVSFFITGWVSAHVVAPS